MAGLAESLIPTPSVFTTHNGHAMPKAASSRRTPQADAFSKAPDGSEKRRRSDNAETQG